VVEASPARAKKEEVPGMKKVSPKNRVRMIDIVTLVAVVGTILGGLLTL